MKSYTLPFVSSLLGTAYAASHSVDVGEGGLVFSPNSTTAAVGDTVTFHFYPRAHGVARSSYSSPCAAIDNGFNSGFVQVASGESATTFTITINNTDPIWYYCPQGDHCQAGMVGVINPPSSGGETIGGFINAASTAGSSTVPKEVYGGILSANGNGTSSGAAAGGSSSSASMASSSNASSMMASSSQASSMMASSSKASSSMASSAAAAGGSSSHSMTASSAPAASGTASHSSGSGSGSATSKAASATSSVAASTGAAVSSKTAGLANLGLGLLFGGWLFL
ncbi:Cupredoxin, partial [Aureobasidium melanogenum]